MGIRSLALVTDVDNLNTALSRTVPSLASDVSTFGASYRNNVDQTVVHFQQMQTQLNAVSGGLDQEGIADLKNRISGILVRLQNERGDNSSPASLAGRNMVQIPPQGINASSSSLYTGPSPSQKQIDRRDPVAMLAYKWGVPADVFKNTAQQTSSSSLFEICSIQRQTNQTLQRFFSDLGVADEDIFNFSLATDGQCTCTIEFGEEIFGTATAPTKEEAQNNAEKSALEALHNHPEYSHRLFLPRAPDSTDAQPTSGLLAFLQLFSDNKNGDELQGIYRGILLPGVRLPRYSCNLIYKGNPISPEAQLGDTKRRARENASRRVLQLFKEQRNLSRLVPQITASLGEVLKSRDGTVLQHLKDVQRVPAVLINMILQYAAEDSTSRLRDQILAAVHRAISEGGEAKKEKLYIRYLVSQLPKDQFIDITYRIYLHASSRAEDASSPTYGEDHLTDNLELLRRILSFSKD